MAALPDRRNFPYAPPPNRHDFGKRGLGNLVEADPARQEGWLTWFWSALRLDGWRRIAIGLLPLLVAGLLAFAHVLGWLRAGDALVYDVLTLGEGGRKPAVVIVETDEGFASQGPDGAARLAQTLLGMGAKSVAFRQDPGFDPGIHRFSGGRVIVGRKVEKVPGAPAWRLEDKPLAPGTVAAAVVIAPAEAGLHRRQIAWLPAERGRIPVFEAAAVGERPPANPYWLRLSRNQNLPRILASQVADGTIGKATLAGTVALVEPPPARNPVLVTSPRDGPGAVTTLGEYQALAVQTLATRSAARPLGDFGATLLIVSIALVTGLIYLRADPKRIMPLLLVTSLAIIAAGTWLALSFANILLPVTALVLAQPLSALLVLHRAELSEDHNLRSFVTRTINLSSRQVLLKDLGRLPQVLEGTAPLLGIERSLLFEVRLGRLEELAATNASLGDVQIERRALRAALRRARLSEVAIDGSGLVPDWSGRSVRLAALGPARGEVYWLYAFAPGKAHTTALDGASGIAADYRTIQQLRADLSAEGDERHEYRPADEWAGSAVRLIAERGDQIGTGLDGLETAVVVFHPIGFPIHANAPMSELTEALGLATADMTLASFLQAATELDEPRAALIVNDLLLHGGEMRIDAREIDTRARQIRVAASQDPVTGRTVSLVAEAIDISGPRRLAALRLSLANLLDVSIRNDLEAIGFALAAARSGKLPPERMERVFNQIAMASDRATTRLDALAPHIQPVHGAPASQSFPIDAVASVNEAIGRLAPLAAELRVPIEGGRPSISGFTIADPEVLTSMVEAMLRIVLSDSAPGEPITLEVIEEEKKTRITISGGIGMAFERLYAALETSDDTAPGPFRAVAEGMATAIGWGAVVSYSSRIGKGYRFSIELRRIG